MPTGVQRRRKTRCERSTLDTPPRRTKKPSRKLRLLDGNEARNDGRNGEKRSNRGSLLSAQGGTRTRTPHGATPSRWCVYQFHHLGLFDSAGLQRFPHSEARVPRQRAPGARFFRLVPASGLTGVTGIGAGWLSTASLTAPASPVSVAGAAAGDFPGVLGATFAGPSSPPAATELCSPTNDSPSEVRKNKPAQT